MHKWIGIAASSLVVAACGSSSNTKTPSEEEVGNGDGEVTWHGDIAPIVAERCLGCHKDEGIAPFSMQTYEEAASYAFSMVAEVEAERMPPWLAKDTDECVPRFGWKDDIRLTDDEKALIAAWASAGAPEGDPETAAAMPAPVALAIDDPDLTLTIPTAVEIDGDTDQFWCFVIETGLADTTYFNQVQVNAGNAAIVHHVLVYNDVDGALDADRIDAQKYECFGGTGVSGAELITAWAPGGVPTETPPDVAYELAAGTRLVMQVHYHPTGAKEIDEATSIDLKLADETPRYRATTELLGNFVAPSTVIGGLLPGTNDPEGEIEFRIPAGASDHVENMTNTVGSEMIIYGAGTHMHYVGRDMVIHLRHNTPTDDAPGQECLIHTPEWDFNWQRGYRYDNSMDNPFVREALEEQGLSAPRDVLMGEETLDEMCLGAFAVAIPIEQQ